MKTFNLTQDSHISSCSIYFVGRKRNFLKVLYVIYKISWLEQ